MHHYQSLIDHTAYTFITEEPSSPEEVDIVLLSDEYYFNTSGKLYKYKSAGIPILHLIDGVLEWRNVWDNPRSTQDEDTGMPLFQSVIADKIALMGDSQKRILEGWNNQGKCEITGSLRLEQKLTVTDTSTPGANKLLVATANTVGFTKEQETATIQALNDLNDFFQTQPHLKVTWRVSPAIANLVGFTFQNTFGEVALEKQLAEVNAVISFPSTVLVEAMIFNKPVCIVDYTRSPQWLSSVWYIFSKDHISATIFDLLQPPKEKIQYQTVLTKDLCDMSESPLKRISKVIDVMVHTFKTAKSRGEKPQLPYSILEQKPALTEFELSEYYQHFCFKIRDKSELQAILGHRSKNLYYELERLESKGNVANILSSRLTFGVLLESLVKRVFRRFKKK